MVDDGKWKVESEKRKMGNGSCGRWEVGGRRREVGFGRWKVEVVAGPCGRGSKGSRGGRAGGKWT